MRRLYENMGIPLRSPLPPERHWNYEMPVFGVNCTVQEGDYLYEVNLTDENFDFSRAELDGGDVEFKDSLDRDLRSFVHRWCPENKTGQCIVAAYKPGDLNNQTFTMFYGNSHKDYDYPKEGNMKIEIWGVPPNYPPNRWPLYWNISGSYDHPFSANTTMPMGYYTLAVHGTFSVWADVPDDPDTTYCEEGHEARVAACALKLKIHYGLNKTETIQGWQSNDIRTICSQNRSLPGQFGFGHFYVPYPALFKIFFIDDPYSDNTGNATLTIYRDTKTGNF